MAQVLASPGNPEVRQNEPKGTNKAPGLVTFWLPVPLHPPRTQPRTMDEPKTADHALAIKNAPHPAAHDGRGRVYLVSSPRGNDMAAPHRASPVGGGLHQFRSGGGGGRLAHDVLAVDPRMPRVCQRGCQGTGGGPGRAYLSPVAVASIPGVPPAYGQGTRWQAPLHLRQTVTSSFPQNWGNPPGPWPVNPTPGRTRTGIPTGECNPHAPPPFPPCSSLLASGSCFNSSRRCLVCYHGKFLVHVKGEKIVGLQKNKRPFECGRFFIMNLLGRIPES